MEQPGSESVMAQRDRANASAQEAWQEVAELRKSLEDTVFAIEVITTQMASWNMQPVVNAEGIAQRARTLLAKTKS